MRLPRPRLRIRRMMISVAVLATGTWAFTQPERSQTYYAAGWWNAECELWQGNATIYALGGLGSGDICNIDQASGLPIQWIAGCVIAKGDFERVKGHNDHIEQYIRWHGLPKNTFKPWEKELFNLKRCFDDRSRTDVPERLFTGGPAVVSPDGRNRVQPVAVANDGESPHDSLKVVIAAGHVVLGDWYVRFGKGDSDVLWGPDHSRFALIRSLSEKTEHYEAYDLNTGRRLRGETWHEGEHRDVGAPISVSPNRSKRVYTDLNIELLSGKGL